MVLDPILFENDGPDGSNQSIDPSLKLPPLMRDLPKASPSPSVVHRTMHQLQLEMEYDAEESDDSDRRSMQGHAGTRNSHETTFQEGTADLATQEIHALCIFDNIPTSSMSQPRSHLMESLSGALPRRKWGRWHWRNPPVLSNTQVLEAIMLYERGSEQSLRCANCRAGKGVSPQCIAAPGHIGNDSGPGPCSNCIYDGLSSSCRSFKRRISNCPNEEHRVEPRDTEQLVDHMAVLQLIAQLKRPSGSCKDYSLPARAKRIETAALYIAQAAREWGERMAGQDSR